MLNGAEPVLLGKIVGVHGLKGQLKVACFSGEFDTILALSTVILEGPDKRRETFSVAGASIHRNRLLLTLKSFADINQAQPLVGRLLYARRDQFPPLPEGEYYWCDLTGLQVVTREGEELGRLTEIIATGSNDVYVVQGEHREYLIPAVEDVVVAIDLSQGIMTVSPPEGLFDL